MDGHSPGLGAVLRHLPQNLAPGAEGGSGSWGCGSVSSLALGLLWVWVTGQ